MYHLNTRLLVFVGEDIGNGAFGRVCLAEAFGISVFNPRKVWKDKSKQNFWSVFRNRNRKRYSYLDCTLKSKVAVKMLKGIVYYSCN